MVKIVPKFAGKDEFWTQFYKELADPHLMRGFFDFFSQEGTMEMNVSSKLVRFDPVANKEQKISSLPRHIKFLRSFFEQPNCFEDPKFCYRGERWWEQIKPNGTRELYISTGKLYELFTRWQMAEGDVVRVKKTTFTTNVRKFLGLRDVPRTYFDKARLRCFLLNKTGCEKAFKAKYKFGQTFDFFWDDPAEFEKLQGGWRSKDWIYKDRPNWL